MTAAEAKGAPRIAPPGERPHTGPNVYDKPGPPKAGTGTTVPGMPHLDPDGTLPDTPQALSPALKADADQNRRPVPQREATRGQRVRLGGKEVQLPPDAYVQGTSVGEPAPEARIQDPGELRATRVRRGNSSAWVDGTGKITSMQDDPAKPGEMDFLREALK
jgi:hypothetical protein